jgi:DNA polymerase-3 subunit delta|tara:strand:+ start:6606 stop:7616 length:1011 start_codon:yes stop_codon:yes gene_type:complete
MKLKLEHLAESLKKELSTAYLISSNEPLLSMRAIDQIKSFATSKGFMERSLYTIGPRFDWSIIEGSINNLSLFSSQKIIEIRIGSQSIGINGSNAIKSLLEKLNKDTLLLISSDKIDFKLSWIKNIDSIGKIVQIWPIQITDLPRWLRSYAKDLNLSLTDGASRLLAERVEGNLLAADQELKKISLLDKKEIIDEEKIIEIVSNNAKYNIFILSEAILSGNRKRTFSILNNLSLEGIQPIQISWLITSDIIKLTRLKISTLRSALSDTVFFKLGIMKRNIPLFKLALNRYSLNDLKYLLNRAHHLDKVLKGANKGHPWCELKQFILCTFNNNLYKN